MLVEISRLCLLKVGNKYWINPPQTDSMIATSPQEGISKSHYILRWQQIVSTAKIKGAF